jgi:hypothetical protein
MGRYVACITEMKDAVIEHEGKEPVRRYRHKWEDNIKTDLGEMGWQGGYWIQLPEDMVH